MTTLRIRQDKRNMKSRARTQGRVELLLYSLIVKGFRIMVAQSRMESRPRRMCAARFRDLAVAGALVVLVGTLCGAQGSLDEFQKVLRDEASFTSDDLTALEAGRAVAKLLPSNDKRELAVSGVVRIHAPADQCFVAFRKGLTSKSNQAIQQIGAFSDPPRIEDLEGLTLDGREIDDIRKCAARDCRLKMSAELIARFHAEVDWASPDYQRQATQLFRQMLLEYVRDYLARGDAALMEYDDKNRIVRLSDEQHSLLEADVYANYAAPEFVNYLKSFPRKGAPAVENLIYWSKVKFGFKPVVTVTHAAVYRRGESAPQVLVALEQIYANHYFDSSLGLVAFLNFPSPAVKDYSYMLYTNRSRVDAFNGIFGELKRSVIENSAVNELRSFLDDRRARLEDGTVDRPAGSPEPDDAGPAADTLDGARSEGIGWVVWAGMAAVIVIVFWLAISRARRGTNNGADGAG